MADRRDHAGSGVRWRAVALVLAALAGAVVLVGLTGSPVRSAGDEGKPPGQVALPPDLRAVPTDAVAFASVRLADLWGQDAARRLREQYKEQLAGGLDEWRKLVGLPPGDVERLTVAFISFPPGGVPLFFVETAKPYDRDKVLANIGPGAKEEKRAGYTLHVGPRNNAVHFLSDRAYVAGSVQDVRQVLEHPAPKKPGVLAEALALAAADHAAVLGVNPASMVDRIGEELPPQAEAYRPLLKTQLATLTVDLGKEVQGNLRLSYAADRDAKEAAKAVKSLLSLARVGLGLAAQQVRKEGDKGANLAGLLGRAQADLEDATVKQQGARLEVSARFKVDVAAAGGVLAEAVAKARGSSERIQSQNNLKQLALAMYNYHDTQRHFPAQAIYSPDGKPLLSWRVLILSYIEHDDLYKQFHLDEPWDSEHNKKLLAKMPKTYLLPGQDEKSTDTHYLGFAGTGAFFNGRKGIGIRDITDGTSNTIMLVEAAKGVPWTKPEDLPFDKDKPLPKRAAFFGGGFNAAFCDGSVHFISQNVKESTLKALITINGGEVVDFNSLNK